MKTNIEKGVFIIFAFVTIVFTSLTDTVWMEVDSYVLPMISIQYRGSIVCTQEDIEQAKIDFPTIYSNVNSYDDLRLSKLKKIDENHWYTYYFPVYAFICMPMKLLLQLVHLDQSKCFALTAGVLLIFAIYMILYSERDGERRLQKYILSLLILVSPIWYNINYIGIEPIAYSLVIIAMLNWRKQRYKSAALIISITCMSNPAIMGVGIAIFIDYILMLLNAGLKDFFKKQNIINIIKLCICYIPSLVPFAINNYFFEKLYLALARSGVEDTLLNRMLAYMFDFNLGIFSFAPIIVILFCIIFIWSIITKNRKILMECIAYFLMLASCSNMIHINCGMLYCARYQMWMYPVMAIAVYDFLKSIMVKKEKIVYMTVAISIIVTFTMMKYNGNYVYVDLSNVSKLILNNYPDLYVSMCDSTFNSRVNHVDGGYNPQGYAIYSDTKTGEIRKIQYRNTEEIKNNLISAITNCGENSSDMAFIQNQFVETDGKIHYITIGKHNSTQFRMLTDEEKKRNSEVGTLNYELGTVLSFDVDNPTANDYCITGFSHNESGFTWTDGEYAEMRFDNDDVDNDVILEFNAWNFYQDQMVNIYVDNEHISDINVNQSGLYSITIPQHFFDDDTIIVKFVLPCAESPINVMGTSDLRLLAVAFESMRIY